MLDLLEYGPIIVFILKSLNVVKPLLFTGFVFINIVINTLLKNLIRQDRPEPTMEYGEYQRFGMPSGHAQLLWFMLFYYDGKPVNKYLYLLMLTITLMTSFQRIFTDKHSIIQVIVGGIVGTTIAFVANKVIRDKKLW
jgi:membrane-associated phospholipid phosphatase